MLHEAERNRIADAAIEERLSLNHDRLRHERHRSTRAEPLHLLRSRGLTLMVDRSAGIAVRRDDVELHRIREEGIPVEKIELLWKRMVAELGIVEVSGLQQGLDAAVAPVLCEALIVADRASDLPRLKIAAEGRTRRHTDHAIEGDSLLQEDIEYTRGEHPAHRAALTHQALPDRSFFFHLFCLHFSVCSYSSSYVEMEHPVCPGLLRRDRIILPILPVQRTLLLAASRRHESYLRFRNSRSMPRSVRSSCNSRYGTAAAARSCPLPPRKRSPLNPSPPDSCSAGRSRSHAYRRSGSH